MKSYKQFLNETNGVKVVPNITIEILETLPINFLFCIDVTNFTDEEINKLFDEFEKYFIIENSVKKHLVAKDSFNKPWAWRVTIRGHNYMAPRMRKKLSDYWVDFEIITTPGWGIGSFDYKDNRITINEFLQVGLEGVKELIESGNTIIKMKKITDKYNIS